MVNGEKILLNPVDGYEIIDRTWKKGDKVNIEFPMPVRTLAADERIKDDIGKIAVQRGPLIYCAEWPDNNTGNVLNLVINKKLEPSSEFVPEMLGGTEIIKIMGHQVERTLKGKIKSGKDEQITLIPYALWNNRGPGQMMVWIPEKK